MLDRCFWSEVRGSVERHHMEKKDPVDRRRRETGEFKLIPEGCDTLAGSSEDNE